MQQMKIVGISPRFMPGDGISSGSGAVDRLAVVDANNQLLSRFGMLPISLPLLQHQSGAERSASLEKIVACCDGLLLQGGTDIEPHRYQETALRPEWAGDALRDRFEFDLLALFLRADKPVLGICRGFQVLNVLFGGSLYQDIPSQKAEPRSQRAGNHESTVAHDSAHYCGASHQVQLFHRLRAWHGCEHAWVNSAHHQGVKSLGAGLQMEAQAPDGIIEGLSSTQHKFVVAVQWHPEFHDRDAKLLASAPLMQAFVAAMHHG